MYDGPVRGGSRGGQGDFRWEDVKNSKHRENYLGATVNAPVGRWQNNRDVHWYSRDVDNSSDARKEEIRQLKEQEEAALAAALGFAPTKTPGEGSGANSIPVGDDAKERRRLEKAQRKEERAQKRHERQLRRDERSEVRRGRKSHLDSGDVRVRERSPRERRMSRKDGEPSRSVRSHRHDHRRHRESRSPMHRTRSRSPRTREDRTIETNEHWIVDDDA